MVGVVTVALGRVPEWIICVGLSNRMLAGRMSMPAWLHFVAPLNEPGSVAVVRQEEGCSSANIVLLLLLQCFQLVHAGVKG